MPKLQIKSRWDLAKVLFEEEFETLKDFVVALVVKGTNLRGADLRGADLRGTNLYGADLCGADLRGADLRGADLRGADLYGADLCGADLRGADLCGTNLRGTNLRGTKIAWQSHSLLGHILLLAAGEDIHHRMIAGLIAISLDWCWDEFLAIEDERREWALRELAKWITEDDGHPEVLDQYQEVTESTEAAK